MRVERLIGHDDDGDVRVTLTEKQWCLIRKMMKRNVHLLTINEIRDLSDVLNQARIED